VLPIERRREWREAKSWAREIAVAIAAGERERYVTRLSKAERRGRIFIDYLRNDPTGCRAISVLALTGIAHPTSPSLPAPKGPRGADHDLSSGPVHPYLRAERDIIAPPLPSNRLLL
jgi:hypothetical protein